MSVKKTNKEQNIAVIDIGSNAVRLVIYDGLKRCPIKIHTERNICGLGRDILNTGHLNPEGVEQALDSLGRFSGMLESLKIKTVFTIATAALRDANDGNKFVKKVEDKFGISINVISGIEEAYLSAQGVAAGFGQVTGVVGDFGGGSLELIAMHNGKILEQETLPLGALRILALKGEQERCDYIQHHLSNISLLRNNQKQNFYVLGGAWRSIGKTHMHMTDYPLQILDHYTIRYTPAVEFMSLLSNQSSASLERMAGLPARRVKDIPPAALVMKHVLKCLKPQNICFSATGLREGVVFDRLSHQLQKQSPLLASCLDLAERTSRSRETKHFKYMAKWLQPLFKNASLEDFDTTLESACFLSDIGWYEHEDYKADNAYQRILHLPFYGASHMHRAILAIATYVRYKGYIRRVPREDDVKAEITASAQSTLTRSQVDLAVQLGLSIRLAHLLTGGALSLLKHTELRLTDKVLRLVLSGKSIALSGHIIEDTLNDLARFYKCKSMITLAH